MGRGDAYEDERVVLPNQLLTPTELSEQELGQRALHLLQLILGPETDSAAIVAAALPTRFLTVIYTYTKLAPHHYAHFSTTPSEALSWQATSALFYRAVISFHDLQQPQTRVPTHFSLDKTGLPAPARSFAGEQALFARRAHAFINTYYLRAQDPHALHARIDESFSKKSLGRFLVVSTDALPRKKEDLCARWVFCKTRAQLTTLLNLRVRDPIKAVADVYDLETETFLPVRLVGESTLNGIRYRGKGVASRVSALNV